MRRLQDELAVLLLALQFLTRIPVTARSAYTKKRMAAAPRYYPLIGILVGLVAAVAYFLSLRVFPPGIAVLVSTCCTLLMTGAFHEDGLADTFDGIGGGSDRSRVLAIMRDSRSGVYGLVALGMTLALKFAALVSLPEAVVPAALVMGHALSRFSSVVVIASSQYVRDEGTGKPTADGIGAISMVVATLTMVVVVSLVLLVLSGSCVAAAVVAGTLGHVVARSTFEKRIGGYSGDCLGATQQLSEVAIYLGLVACL